MMRGLFKRIRLGLVFSLIVFIILSITGFILATIAIIMYRTGLIDPTSTSRFPAPILLFILASVLLGTFVSFFLGRVLLKPIRKMIDATNKLADGDFSVRLNMNTRLSFRIWRKALIGWHRNSAASKCSATTSSTMCPTNPPLSAIEGYAALLQNKSLSEEKRDAYVAKILYNTKRLSSMTGNILQLSRLENQEITAEKQWFSLDEQIRQIILVYEARWTEKNLEL